MEDTDKHINRVSRRLIAWFKENSKDSSEQIDSTWKQILEKSGHKKQQSRKRIYWFSVSAAAVLAVIMFRIIPSESLPERSVLYDLAAYQSIEDTEDITLFVGQKEAVILPSDTVLFYSQMDTSITNTLETEENATGEQVFDQVVVPRGKRLQLVLSDNSRMWVNSGTRVIYPRTFTSDIRELYVEGEIYLEVEPDKKRPFVVRTNQFEVKVLGTTFNICAYEDFSQSVVLVEGSVDVSHTNGENIVLKPEQQVSISHEGPGVPVRVNVADHISWIKNQLSLRGEPLETVIRKLQLYYGTEFILDGNFTEITLSGKLDLQDKVEDIIHSLTATAPINYNIQDKKIVITNQ